MVGETKRFIQADRIWKELINKNLKEKYLPFKNKIDIRKKTKIKVSNAKKLRYTSSTLMTIIVNLKIIEFFFKNNRIKSEHTHASLFLLAKSKHSSFKRPCLKKQKPKFKLKYEIE
jgi:hypothetical protein